MNPVCHDKDCCCLQWPRAANHKEEKPVEVKVEQIAKVVIVDPNRCWETYD